MRTSFARFVMPDTIATRARGSRNASAKNAISASFAFPSSGGAVSAIFTASAWTPVTPFFRAPMDSHCQRASIGNILRVARVH